MSDGWEDVSVGSSPAPNKIQAPDVGWLFTKHTLHNLLRKTLQPDNKLPPRDTCSHTRSQWQQGKWVCADCYTTL